jgi:hypothetical protein
MAEWSVDGESKPGILHLRLQGRFTEKEMLEFVQVHNRSIDAFKGKDYRVLCDIRGLSPLSPECAEIFQKAKTYSNAHTNFQGSAVWIDNAIAALQHRRTSDASGVLSTELISDREEELMQHLSAVRRHS